MPAAGRRRSPRARGEGRGGLPAPGRGGRRGARRRRRRSRGLVKEELRRKAGEAWAFRTRVEREAARRFARLAAAIAAFDAQSPVPGLLRQAAEDEHRHAALCADLSAVYGQPIGAAAEDAAIAP